MTRIHRAYNFLLAGESPDGVAFDLVYRPEPGTAWPATTLVVDYDLSRLRRNGARRSECAELEDLAGPFARVLVQVSQFDSLLQVKRDVFAASRVLGRAGELRVTVPPKSGAKRITSDLSRVFARVEAVKTAGLTLLICHEPTPREFDDEPSYVDYRDPASGRALRFLTRPGVFSGERVDAGTDFLLNTVTGVAGRKVLDVGCGYGAVGVVAAARGAASSLLDVDARVVKLARHNLGANGLGGEVFLKLQPYDFADGAFDVVLSNPPTHAGSETLRELFGEMVRVCGADGYVAVVVRERLNYEKWLQELGAVQRLGTSQGYKVLEIRKSARA